MRKIPPRTIEESAPIVARNAIGEVEYLLHRVQVANDKLHSAAGLDMEFPGMISSEIYGAIVSDLKRQLN